LLTLLAAILDEETLGLVFFAGDAALFLAAVILGLVDLEVDLLTDLVEPLLALAVFRAVAFGAGVFLVGFGALLVALGLLAFVAVGFFLVVGILT
jgi:hypothetical protein